ncbi:MAG: hypothetical protein J6W81_01810 [Lentisphaeria bacterium]|nr:hypothetical protein [Lentisphaeria bacterium]
MKKTQTILSLALAGLTLATTAAEAILKIPFKQDPPISVDGNLSDWSDAQVGIMKLEGEKYLLRDKKPNQKIVAPTAKDLSATFYFSWKPIGLYFAAEIKDDKLIQRGVDMDIFAGDHVELFLDLAPTEKGDGAGFGKKQLQIGISPGNFKNLKPSIVVAYPSGKTFESAQCAAEKTASGWNLEAFIPWKELGAGTILRNNVIGLTAWVSDTDVDAGGTLRPEHIMTSGKPDASFRNRAEITPAVFTDSNGKHEAVISLAETIPLKDMTIQPSTTQKIEFTAPKTPAYLTPVLRMNANLRSAHTFSGYARVMHVYVNGKELTQYNLLKPENEFRTKNGAKSTIFQKGHGYLLPYTKDGKAGNQPKNTARFFASHYNMHEFVLDLSGLLKEGKNTITIKNTLQKKYNHALDLTNAKISFEAVAQRKTRKPAPTGKIPVIKLKKQIPLNNNFKQNGNTIEFAMNHGKYILTSRFSTPDGKWVNGSCKYFKHQRVIEKKNELLLVKDTYTNLTNENLPLMQEHTVKVPGKNTSLYLGGLENISGRNIRRVIGNFSIFGGQKNGGGVGLYAINPEFQIHSGSFIPAPHCVTLCDDQFVLPPGKSFTQQFVVVPLENGKYYDFVNVVRRYLNINKTLRGPECSWAAYKWQEAYYNRLEVFNIQRIIVDLPKIGHLFLNSPDIPFVKSMIVKLRKIRPNAELGRYYHSQIESDLSKDYKEGRVLLKNGQQARYGHSKLYLTLEGTEYSIIMEKALDDILNNWDVDAVYWDEFASSGVDYHYGAPWDQCSADISPVTHKITALKSSVWILQRPWKNRMADKIRAKGKKLYANGGDAMLAEFAEKIESTFTETQFASNNARVHFSTPISHANSEHMDRGKFSEWYDKFLSALDYGCLFTYAFISQPHYGPIYHTVSDHIYPSTPLEIHEGYMIAEERIVTSRSGFFGWEDNSKHKIYVYDYTGREVKDHKLKTVQLNGWTYSEIRLPQDWSAIIVRNK